VDQLPCVERCTDRADPPVHHVGGRDDVHAGLRLGQRLLLEDGDGLVVQDVPGLVEDAVLAVGRVGVQRHVGHHAELGKALLDLVHDLRNQPFGVGRLPAVRRLERGLDRREERERRDA